jgi:hypothetical protein
MKLDLGNDKVVVSGTADQFGFGIAQDGLATVIDIISNRIYSDKILAVIREYSCNASDANKDAGKAKKPIRVTLPTQLDPVFKVRDFGKGLNEEQIKGIFVQYGSSTKRDSNKFVGMFGIGSKSGFSYGNSFVVSSYVGGKRNDYSAYMDNKMPKMALLATDETTEEDGLEIQIPVKLNDIPSFIDKAKTFFFYWEVRPEFVGTKIEFPKEEVALEGKGWKITKNAGMYGNRIIAVMGNVPYPVDPNSLNIVSNKSLQLSRHPITLTFKIGDLGVNAGREGLEYDDRTRKNIVDKLDEIVNVFGDKIREQFKDCKTMFESKLKIVTVFDPYGPLNQMTQYFDRAQIQFDGVEVRDNTYGDFRFGLKEYGSPGFMDIKLYQRGSGRTSLGYGKFWVDSHCSRMSVADNILYVINDEGEITSSVTNKFAPLLELDGSNPLNCLKKRYNSIYLITINDQAMFDAWKKGKVFDAPTVLLSSLTKVKLKDVYGVTVDNSASILAQKTKVFTLDFAKRSHYSAKREYYKASEVDLKNGKGLYVVIDRFYALVPEGITMFKDEMGMGRTLAPQRLASVVTDFINHITPKGRTPRFPVIYAVRSRDVQEMGKGFKCFFKSFQPQLNRVLDSSLVASYVERENALATQHSVSNVVVNWFRKNRKSLPNHEMSQILTNLESKLNTHRKDKIDKMVELASRFGLTLPVGVSDAKIVDEISKIADKYPMIKGVTSGYYSDNVSVDEVIAYINLVDKKK